ncbi:MAG: hypothetical protein AAB036_12330 [Elusimicrobiota bacterium]
MTFHAAVVLLSLLAYAPPASAMPDCPSAWRFPFSPQTEHWPDLEKTFDLRLLYGMTRELYENCPRKDENDKLLILAAHKFLTYSADNPDQEHARQEVLYWLGMTHALRAGHPATSNDHAIGAYNAFIRLTDPELRLQAAPQTRALRVRNARRSAYLAYYAHLNAANWGKPGWAAASRRIRCFLNTYPDMTHDDEIHDHLSYLLAQAKAFVAKHADDSRYKLESMAILIAELEYRLAAPAPPVERWPTEGDIDPTDINSPDLCDTRPSPIPGPEFFDFDFSEEAMRHRREQEIINERRRRLAP